MTRPLPSAAYCGAATIALGLALIASSTPSTARVRQHELSQPAGSNFNFQTVDDPASASPYNRVTDINDAGEITGNYGSTTCPSATDPLVSFTATENASTWSFTQRDYPSSNGTYLSSLPAQSSTVQLGYVCNPKALPALWGTIVEGNSWTLIPKDPNEPPSGPCKQMELFGINDSNNSVGFYSNANCVLHAIEVTAGENFIEFHPPNMSDPEATGIDDNGDVVGFGMLTSGSTMALWYLPNGSNKYVELQYPSSTTTATEPYGVNAIGQIVGSFTDTSDKTHGFILSNPSAPSPAWQEVTEPKNLGVTVVSGINDSGDICGWYVGAGGKTHGFVATPASSLLKQGRNE